MNVTLNPGVSYHIPNTFPDTPEHFYDCETVTADNTELGQFVMSSDGDVYVVLDKFDTEDGQGAVVLTGNAMGDLNFWSTQADFYLVQ
jgi:hypothetical protein